MRRVSMLVTVAGRRVAADGVAFIGSRYARRVLALSATLTAVLVVGLLGYATSSRADVSCRSANTGIFCMEKTATPDPVKVGQTLTFTIRGFCEEGILCDTFSEAGMRDTLPPDAGLEFVSASATGLGDPTCSESAGTVTCAPFAYQTFSPFEATIKVIPSECGSFTNTATDLGTGDSASETFAVEGCPKVPDKKEECKKGGWEALDWPDQGTCISAWNNKNRP
jgi:hypothetical protein